jgi:hypothetical protein
MRNAALPYALVLSAFAAASLLACGSDSPPETPAGASFASCKAIVDACHDVDEGVGPVHECHDLSHEATTDEACAARRTECVATCSAAAHDAGTSDASDGSPGDSGVADAHAHGH